MTPMSNLHAAGGTIYVTGSGEKTECYQAKGFFSKVKNYLFGRKATQEDIEQFHNKCFKQLATTRAATLDDIGQYAQKVHSLFQHKLISAEAFKNIRDRTITDLTTQLANYSLVAPRLLGRNAPLSPFANVDKSMLQNEISVIETWLKNIPSIERLKSEQETQQKINIIRGRLRLGF